LHFVCLERKIVKEKIEIQSLLKRYLTLTVSLFIMTFGVSLSIRANLGSSPISVIPYVCAMAHGQSFSLFGHLFTVPVLSFGGYTNCMNIILVLVEIILLRKNYQKLQLLQLVIGFLFAFFLDLNMWLTAPLQWSTTGVGYVARVLQLLIGSTVLAFGVTCEVRCKALMMPGEGFSVALSQVLRTDFGKIKIYADTSFVVAGIGFCYLFFGTWRWDLIGAGTLISMVYVGLVVHYLYSKTRWLDSFLFKTPADEYEKESPAAFVPVAANPGKVPLVITISRYYGSGGHEIGEKLAEKLGIDFYDRKIIDRTAEESGFAPEFIEQKEQNISNTKLLELIMTDKQIPEDLNLSYNDTIFVTQSRIIHNIAQDKSCVIIGRCADYILRNHPNKFSILVFSDIDFAIQRIVNEFHLSPVDAEKKIHKTNHVRRNHYWQYTDRKWDDATLYDMAINSSNLGIDRTVEVITEAVKEKL
jgi:uncharacterized protein